VKYLVKIRMTFVDPKKANAINDIWKAKIETEKFDKSISRNQKIIGLKEYLEGPITEI
jgi:enamine deaminase RidA (YjgF/YER057c/UK114 family)